MDDIDEDAIQTGGACRGGSPPAACRVLDLDFDGDYDSADETLFASLDDGYMAHPGRRFSSVGQPWGHQGLPFDAEIGQYQNRARQYDPGMRRFVQREAVGPAPGHIAGNRDYARTSLYGYVDQNPISITDPLGWTRDPLTSQVLANGVSAGTCECDGGKLRECMRLADQAFWAQMESCDNIFYISSAVCATSAAAGYAWCFVKYRCHARALASCTAKVAAAQLACQLAAEAQYRSCVSGAITLKEINQKSCRVTWCKGAGC